LLRNGHTNLLKYRINFFYISLEEISDSIEDIIRYNSLAHRVSKLDPSDYEKFMNTSANDKTSKKTVTVDHEAQMKQFMED